jgi:hypothetical protein
MSADPPDLTEIISEIQRLEGGDLYMLLDPARNPDVLLKLDQLGLPMMPIFYREVSKELRPVVPYLTTCYADSPLVSWLAEHGWGQGLGHHHAQLSARIRDVSPPLPVDVCAARKRAKSDLSLLGSTRAARVFYPPATKIRCSPSLGRSTAFCSKEKRARSYSSASAVMIESRQDVWTCAVMLESCST